METKSRFAKHLKEKKNYYILSGIVLGVFMVLFAFVGIFPFGSKSVAHYDMFAQICTFFGLIFDAIAGKSTLVFSNFVSGGANIVGYITYFIFSPFYLLLLPFGKSGIVYAINIVFVLQELAIAITFLWFIRKYFKLSNSMQILFAILYAVSPYVLFNYTWFSWLYIYMLLPLFVDRFICLLKTGKIFGFVYVVTSMIYACYGMGLFSQVMLFILAILFIFLMIRDSEKRKNAISKMLLAYGMAVVLSLPLLFLNFAQLLEGSRLGNITENFATKELFASIWFWVIYLLSDMVSLLFAGIYIFKCDKTKAINKFLIGALALNLAPAIIDGILLMFSMGSYYGYVNRMSYILSFIILICAILYIKDIERKENNVVSSVKTKSALGVFVSVLGVVAIAYMIIVYSGLSSCMGNLNIQLEVVMIYSLIPLLVCIGVVILNNRRKDGIVSTKLWRVFIILLCGVQVMTNLPLVSGESLWDSQPLSFISEQSENLEVDYGYRIKDVDRALGNNEHLLASFSSYSGFSSSISGVFVDSADSLGYFNTGNSVASWGGTLLSDSFLGYRYCLAKNYYDYPWLRLLDSTTYGDDEYYFYENTLALNSAILVDKDKTLDLSGNIMSNTQSLFEYLGGSGEVIKKTRTLDLFKENRLSEMGITLDYSESEGLISIECEPSEYNKILYAVLNVEEGKYVAYKLGKTWDEPVCSFTDTFFSLGYLSKDGENMSAYIDLADEYNKKEITIYELNYDMVETLITSLQEQVVDFEYTAKGFKIKTTAEDKKVVVTNSNISKYEITLNGAEIEPKGMEFIELNLLNGENRIEAKYVYPYTNIFVLSLVLCALGMAILIAIYLCLKRFAWLRNLLYYAGLGLFAMFLCLFFFVPSSIFVIRVCLLKF